MAYVSTIVSGAASLGVLIGLITGIFFLVLTALRWVTRVRESLYEEELRRQKRFLINGSYLAHSGSQDFVESRKAENGFAAPLTGNNRREEEKSEFQCNPGSVTQWTEREADENVPGKQDPNADTVKVRELIEKMVETMIEGPLDGTTVGQLSTHSAWKNAMEVDATDLTQTNLRRLIKRIVAEAMCMPNIKEVLRPPRSSKAAIEEDFKNKSYEDILATAILNKVIENFQNKNFSDAVDGNPKPRLRKKKIRRNEDKSDDDWSDTSRSDQLSLTIEEYIEEVTTALEVSDDDRSELSDFETVSNRRVPFPESGRTVVDAGTDDENSDLEEPNAATELITSPNSWEENWLFQKKRLRSTPNAHHPVPVPMLVPNPSEDFRALVGGVDADDLSDISDCDLEELITNGDKSQSLDVVPEQEVPEVREEENSKDALIAEESPCGDDREEVVVGEGSKEDPAVEGCNPRGDGEESLGGVLPDALSQKDRESSIVDFSHQYESLGSNSPSERITESDENTVKCPLAEREREKWMNPVPLAENPYSLESIEKRDQRKKTEYFRIGTYTGESIDFPDDLSSDELSKKELEKLRFSRDYYINASKHPAGVPTPKRPPDDFCQRFTETNEAPTEKPRELAVGEMEPEKNPRVVDKGEFRLPNVKELAKHFTKEDAWNARAQTKPPHGEEPEVDYSTTPVSEIISNLQHAAESVPVRNNQIRHITYSHATQMEICRKDDAKVVEKPDQVRFNGKQVHSLTARSISKEFREGLKHNSYQKSYPRIDRSSSGGESYQGDVICNRKATSSPTPWVDLKNVKQFWETIITANANSTKHK